MNGIEENAAGNGQDRKGEIYWAKQTKRRSS